MANVLKNLPIKKFYVDINDFYDGGGFVSIDIDIGYHVASNIAMCAEEDADEAMYSIRYKGDIIVMNTIDLYDYPKMINEIINGIKELNYGRK